MSRFKMVLVSVSIVLMLCLAGCSSFSATVPEDSSFITVEEHTRWAIVAHKDTGVMYVASRDWYAFSVLVNPDGTPMIWSGENDE